MDQADRPHRRHREPRGRDNALQVLAEGQAAQAGEPRPRGRVAVPAPLFRLVQLEFPWLLGPEDGRYVIRGHAGEPKHILVLSTLGAPQRRLLGARKARDVTGDPEPEPVPTARALLAGAEPFETPDAARAWLGDADLEAEADGAVASLNSVLHAHRIAAADPFAREVSRAQAIAVRVGLGEGEQIAHGRLAEARQLPPYRSAKVKREAALRPQERLAAILGGRDAALACEELTLRARLDVERGRWREAAFQIRVALEAALAELEPWAGRAPGLAERLGDLREQRGPVGGAANTALQGGLSQEDIEDVEHALGLIEAALRARTAMGID